MRGFVLLLALIASVMAHELWFEKSVDKLILVYGHLYPQKGEDARIVYRPENVKVIKCLYPHAEGIKGYPSYVKADCELAFAVISTGYWSKTPYGTKNLPKDKVEGAIDSWLSYEISKHVSTWREDFVRPITDELEIVPSKTLTSAKSGEKVSFYVYYRKKPLRGVVVAHNGKPIGQTDEDGRIGIILKPGLNIVSTSYREKADGIHADHVVYSSNLSFEVK